MRIQRLFSAVSSLTQTAVAAASAHVDENFFSRSAEIWSAKSSLVARFPASKKLLFIVLSIVAIGLCGGTNTSASTIPLSAFTGACAPLPPPSFPNFKTRLDAFVMGNCYGVNKQNWPHEADRRSSEGLHSPFVKLWYSPQLYRWMTPGNRQGQIPDGSVVIKEEYDDDVASSPICFWSVMIRDSNLWWDGWSWAVVGVEGACGAAPPPTRPPSERMPRPTVFVQWPHRYQLHRLPRLSNLGFLDKRGQPWNRNLLHAGIRDRRDRGERERNAPVFLSADPNGTRSPCAIGQRLALSASHWSMHGARDKGFGGVEALYVESPYYRAFAVRYFESMCQLSRRY